VKLRRALLAGLVMLALASPAHAFVRSRTKDGMYQLYWKESCVPVTIYLNGFIETERLQETAVVKSIAAGAHAWGPDGVTCLDGTSHPYLEIVTMLSPAASAPTGYDARNVLIFRTESWTVGGKPGTVAYDPNALAVTTVISKGDGHIVDADMELNAVGTFSWANIDPGVFVPGSKDGRLTFDIQNTVTHEFGHLIGLDHTCFVDDPNNPKLQPRDDKGNLVPFCDAAEASAFADTTMFVTAMDRETSKRTLADDDINAVCTIYKATLEHSDCSLDQPAAGCTVAATPVTPRPSRRPVFVLVLVLVLVAVPVVQRRRST
jgi:hypothetical protein